MAANSLVGAGFESFWLNPHVHDRLWELFPNLGLNEAHNGYIEVYLELGWVGVSLIGLILIVGYRRAVRAFRRDPPLGGLFTAYILAAAVYNITEAGFRMLDAMWVFLLLAVVGTSIVAAGFPLRELQPSDASTDRTTKVPAKNVGIGATACELQLENGWMRYKPDAKRR